MIDLVGRFPEENEYSSLPNNLLQDDSLSLMARGLAADILSRPKDWRVQIKMWLSKEHNQGQYRLRNALMELRKAGYCRLVRLRNDLGYLTGSIWFIRSRPNVINDIPDGDIMTEQQLEGRMRSYGAKPYINHPQVDEPQVDDQHLTKERDSQKKETNKTTTAPKSTAVQDWGERSSVVVLLRTLGEVTDADMREILSKHSDQDIRSVHEDGKKRFDKGKIKDLRAWVVVTLLRGGKVTPKPLRQTLFTTGYTEAIPKPKEPTQTIIPEESPLDRLNCVDLTALASRAISASNPPMARLLQEAIRKKDFSGQLTKAALEKRIEYEKKRSDADPRT